MIDAPLHLPDEPEWLADRRQEAYKAFAALDWPHNRVEEWRYTDPRLFDLERTPVTTPGEAEPLTDGIIPAAGELAGGARIVDGGVVRTKVNVDGLVVADLREAARTHPELVAEHLGSVVGIDEKFDALNLAAFTAGVLVYVPDDLEVVEPIAIAVQVTKPGAHLPRILVVAGAHAKATVYVDHTGDAEATVVEAVEVVAGAGSQVNLVTAQDWGDHVDHIASHRGVVHDNADYTHLEITFGGKTVYIRPDVGLDHPGGNAELLGVYFSDDDQRFEHRSLIHHNASRTSSHLVYKGALQGASRATFFGNIRIEPHAAATSSDQTNRNLILTDGAKADSIPFLEIENSDVVRCGHHSSVGQVDETQLFYLQSRGIPRDEAARLLVFGFFAEVTDRIKLPGVAEVVLGEIEQEILSGPTTLMDPRRR